MGRASAVALLAALGAAVYLAPRGGRAPHADPHAPARRVVSLLPGHTEIVFEAGAGDLLVGVSRFCDHPPEARGIEPVGDVLVDYEKVFALQPDLVLSSETMMSRPNADLASLGLRVYATDPEDWNEIAELLRAVGRVTGRTERGEAAAARLLGRVRDVEARVAGRARPRVAFLEPGPNQIQAAGPGSEPDIAIRTAGGINVFAGLRRWDWIDWEAVAVADPDFIVVPAGATLRTGLRAKVVEIDESIIVRPGPRLARAAEILAEAFHP